MAIEDLGAKPTGGIGRIIGILMNRLQTAVYAQCIDKRLPPDGSMIVDIGCGGGRFIKYLSESNPSFQLLGIDHSSEMVKLSKWTNRRQLRLKHSQVTILHASVKQIPLDDNQADLVTAFDTINFWPDIQKSFSEVLRILKKGGKFLIMNGFPSEGSRWWRIAKLKSDKEYVTMLTRVGFRETTVDLNHKPGWIVATATK